MSNPQSNFFSRHGSIEEILISLQILHNSQSQTRSLVLPIKDTKKGDSKTFSQHGSCQNCAVSSCPHLLKKVSLDICLTECKNYQSMTDSNPSVSGSAIIWTRVITRFESQLPLSKAGDGGKPQWHSTWFEWHEHLLLTRTGQFQSWRWGNN